MVGVIFGLLIVVLIGMAAGLAAIAASIPARGIGAAIWTTAAPGYESMRAIAIASGIALIVTGVTLGFRMRRRLLASFVVRGRGQVADFVAYFVVCTLVLGGAVGLEKVANGPEAYNPYGQSNTIPVILGVVLLAPPFWWIFRRVFIGK